MLCSTGGFLTTGNGTAGRPTCLLEWLKNAEVGVEMQELAFVRMGSRGWRHQDHPKWKTHVFRGSLDGGGHGVLWSPGEGGRLKRSKPTLFQSDLCAVPHPKILTHNTPPSQVTAHPGLFPSVPLEPPGSVWCPPFFPSLLL